jgi:hypothetical protein
MDSSQMIMESVLEPSHFVNAASVGLESKALIPAVPTMGAVAPTSFPWEKMFLGALGLALVCLIVYFIVENIRLEAEIQERRRLNQIR